MNFIWARVFANSSFWCKSAYEWSLVVGTGNLYRARGAFQLCDLFLGLLGQINCICSRPASSKKKRHCIRSPFPSTVKVHGVVECMVAAQDTVRLNIVMPVSSKTYVNCDYFAVSYRCGCSISKSPIEMLLFWFIDRRPLGQPIFTQQPQPHGVILYLSPRDLQKSQKIRNVSGLLEKSIPLTLKIKTGFRVFLFDSHALTIWVIGSTLSQKNGFKHQEHFFKRLGNVQCPGS